MSKRIISNYVPLDKSQQSTRDFDCGKEPINNYLKQFAHRNMALNLSRTFVLPYSLPSDTKKSRIAAFYTLANLSISREEIPPDNHLPRYPVPVILIAQLGVDKKFQGSGIGKKSLITALRQAWSIAVKPQGIPSYAVVLDVLDENAMKFYGSFDFFTPLPGKSNRLFVSIKSLEGI